MAVKFNRKSVPVWVNVLEFCAIPINVGFGVWEIHFWSYFLFLMSHLEDRASIFQNGRHRELQKYAFFEFKSYKFVQYHKK